MPMCRNSKEVSESRRQKAIELLLGYEFEERRFGKDEQVGRKAEDKNDKTSGQRGRSFLGWLAMLHTADRLDTYPLVKHRSKHLDDYWSRLTRC